MTTAVWSPESTTGAPIALGVEIIDVIPAPRGREGDRGLGVDPGAILDALNRQDERLAEQISALPHVDQPKDVPHLITPSQIEEGFKLAGGRQAIADVLAVCQPHLPVHGFDNGRFVVVDPNSICAEDYGTHTVVVFTYSENQLSHPPKIWQGSFALKSPTDLSESDARKAITVPMRAALGLSALYFAQQRRLRAER